MWRGCPGGLNLLAKTIFARLTSKGILEKAVLKRLTPSACNRRDAGLFLARNGCFGADGKALDPVAALVFGGVEAGWRE